MTREREIRLVLALNRMKKLKDAELFAEGEKEYQKMLISNPKKRAKRGR